MTLQENMDFATII